VPSTVIVPSSLQEEEAQLRAALRASVETSSSSARRAGVDEREPRRHAARAAHEADLAAERWDRSARDHERARWAQEVEAVASASRRSSRAHARPQSRQSWFQLTPQHAQTHDPRQRARHVPRNHPARARFHQPALEGGTAFYPTHATFPGASAAPEPRARVDAASAREAFDRRQLEEALALSKEEADLAQALRRSVLETLPAASRGDRAAPPLSPRGDDSVPRRGREGSREARASAGPGTDRDREAAEVWRAAASAFRRVAREEKEKLGSATGTPAAAARAAGARSRDDSNDSNDSETEVCAAVAQSARDRDAASLEALERAALEQMWASAREDEALLARERAEEEALNRSVEERRRRREAREATERAEREVLRKARARAMEAESVERERLREERARATECASLRVANELGELDLPGALCFLGVLETGAVGSARSVRKAYRRAALRFHPDRTRGLSVAERARGEETWKALGSKMQTFEARTRSRGSAEEDS
jgi:hypothetical protein